MGEIQERLDDVEVQRKHLGEIRRQVETELVALNITEKIAQAKEELALLRASRDVGEEVDEERVAELRRFIEEASLRAGEAITGHSDVPRL